MTSCAAHCDGLNISGFLQIVLYFVWLMFAFPIPCCLITFWKLRWRLQWSEEIVIELQPFELSEGGERLRLDGGDLTFRQIESLQFLKFQERVPGHLTYGVAPQVEDHQVTAVPESLLGHTVQQVPAEVDLHQVGDPFEAAPHHHADATVVEEDLLQVVQVSFTKHAFSDFAKVVVGEIEDLCGRI